MFFTGLLLGAALYGLFVATRCAFRVDEGHLGVLVTFGRAETSDGKQRLVTYGPGLHAKKPWQRVVQVSMKEHSLDLTKEEGGGSAMADDGTILRLDAFVRYVPVEKELYEFLFAMHRPLEHITGLFTCLLRNEIANFRPNLPPASERALDRSFDFEQEAGSYALIRRERKLLSERIETFSRERIAGRYGVRFNAVDLADILPPDELADALNAVMQAHSEADAQLHRAEGECRQRVVAAERGVEIARARSAAVETEIVKLASYLEALQERGVLGSYVARRRAEVGGESRALFVKEVRS